MVSVRMPKRVYCVVVTIVAAGIALPLVFAWLILGQASCLLISEARNLLHDPSTLLVTVDPNLSSKIPEAAVWPYQSILATGSVSQIQGSYREKKILLICSGGIWSAVAARHLRKLGLDQVFSLRGGFQEWITQPVLRRSGLKIRIDPSESSSVLFFRPSPLFEQWAAVFTFFGVKFVYSILAAFLIFLLWRETAADLIALRWSMLAFFIGEGFCFVNVVLFGDHFLLFEHLHSIGMVVSAAFFVYALLEGVDSRLIHFSGEGHCAAAGLCIRCFKHSDVPCGLRRTFLAFIPFLGIIAVLPLFSPLRDTAYNTIILGTLYGYRHPLVHQLYELRYLPIAAVLLFTGCFLLLLTVERRQVQISKVLFSAALGTMLFSFFRLVLVAVFIENQVWFAAWEEISELLFVISAGMVFYLFPGISPSMNRLFRMNAERRDF